MSLVLDGLGVREPQKASGILRGGAGFGSGVGLSLMISGWGEF